MADEIKVFDADDAGEEWFAARSAEEAAEFAAKECDYDLPPDRFIELDADSMATMPFEYFAEDGKTILTRPFAEQLAMSLAEGMSVPCMFASSNWR